jgi:putative transcriptional regulator
MMETTSLADHYLIAMPTLQDPNFFHGVTYICEHNENGAMGIIVNRPLDMGLEEIFAETDTHSDIDAINHHPVYLGGPVQNERGFIIHQPPGDWDNLLKVSDHIGVASSRDLLQAIAKGEGPPRLFVALGYAGWGPGQLDQEMTENAWLSVPAKGAEHIIFDVPDHERWQAAAALTGVDMSRLSPNFGHA